MLISVNFGNKSNYFESASALFNIYSEKLYLHLDFNAVTYL